MSDHPLAQETIREDFTRPVVYELMKARAESAEARLTEFGDITPSYVQRVVVERDDARQALAEALARETETRELLRLLASDSDDGCPCKPCTYHIDLAYKAFALLQDESSFAALLLALSRAAVVYVERSRTDILEAKKRWEDLKAAVDAALADPTLAAILKEHR